MDKDNQRDSTLKFPDGFLWGVGTSAYQNEGDSFNTQWYEFEQRGGIITGVRCGKACNWWEAAEKDFDIAESIGINSMRLTICWSRVEPEEGHFDPQAIRRYRQMLEALIERGIQPMICLHHFANPIWFERKGAFLSDQSVLFFSRFTEIVLNELGDLCSQWVTINEPNVVAALGYIIGMHPPAKSVSFFRYARALGNLALCHAAAYRIIHKAQPDSRVSFANHFLTLEPANPISAMDRMVTRLTNAVFNNGFIDMVATGKLPLLNKVLHQKLQAVKNTWDFIPINIYGKFLAAFDIRNIREGFMRRMTPQTKHVGDPDVEGNGLYGEIYPQGIADIARKYRKYNKPVFILENGLPDRNDRLRPWLITTAVKTMHALIAKGIDVIGYHHWTLLDNFEWTHGYSLRFGLVEVDFESGHRKPRKSAELYSKIIRHNGLSTEMVNEYIASKN